MPVDVVVPELGESVTEAILVEWLKAEGETVEADEPIAVLETDKADVELPAPSSGVLKQLKSGGDTIEVGQAIGQIAESGEETSDESDEDADEEAAKAESGKEAEASDKDKKEARSRDAKGEDTEAKEADDEEADDEEAEGSDKDDALSPAVRRLVNEHNLDPDKIEGTGKDGRLTKEDVLAYLDKDEETEKKKEADQDEDAGKEDKALKAKAKKAIKKEERAEASQRVATPVQPPEGKSPASGEGDGTRREPMSRLRQRIAQRLVSTQQTAAMLTTFNEADMTGIFELRTLYKERFQEVHGVSLGLMSFFVRASVLALQDFPEVNASIDGTDIVYHDYVHMGIAVGTDRGLVVPVLKHTEAMSFAKIESEIKRVASSAREGKLGLDELSGGTFTITNGGVFGSMLSTPILNAPQTGILGMHAIQKRPVAIDDEVVVRPMMYLALTYDHRLIDGQTSVKFLVRLKQLLEDPARMMLGV